MILHDSKDYRFKQTLQKIEYSVEKQGIEVGTAIRNYWRCSYENRYGYGRQH